MENVVVGEARHVYGKVHHRRGFATGASKFTRSGLSAWWNPRKTASSLSLIFESGDYEIDEEHTDASRRMRERRPHSIRYTGKIGEEATYHIGWGTGQVDD